nr:MFS transporter [Micromonospora sp. DSM 115978]
MRRLAWLVWAGGLLVWVVGIFHRFSLSVAGVDAVDQLGVTAAGLATIAVLQIAVYAALQVPVGVLVDRYGYRRIMLAGALTMVAGQVALAFSAGLGLALGARLLVGLGDGVMFISMVRLITGWFPAARNPVMVQLTGFAGQLGAIASAVPLVILLDATGWRDTFLIAAGVGLVSALGAVLLLREPPPTPRAPVPAPRPLSMLRRAWAETGTRLGFWTHFATQFSCIAFALLWGYPFLVLGQGLTPGSAGVLLSVVIVSFMVSGPALGVLVGRYPLRRSRMALIVVGATATAWTVVLLWPGRAPLWALVALAIVLGVNQPGSMIGFDHARSFNPAERIGTATGIVNVGGHVASLACILAIGVVLGALTGPGEAYAPDSFRWAFLVQYPLWAIGALQIVRYRRRARRAYDNRPALAFG